jgi:hypothetical protein
MAVSAASLERPKQECRRKQKSSQNPERARRVTATRVRCVADHLAFFRSCSATAL